MNETIELINKIVELELRVKDYENQLIDIQRYLSEKGIFITIEKKISSNIDSEDKEISKDDILGMR